VAARIVHSLSSSLQESECTVLATKTPGLKLDAKEIEFSYSGEQGTLGRCVLEERSEGTTLLQYQRGAAAPAMASAEHGKARLVRKTQRRSVL